MHAPLKKQLFKLYKKYSRPITPLPPRIHSHLPATPAPKAVLFDVYGTLFISGSGDVGTVQGHNSSYALAEAFKLLNIGGVDDQLLKQINQLIPVYIHQRHLELKKRGIAYPEIDIRHIFRDIFTDSSLKANMPIHPSDQLLEQFCIAHEAIKNPVWPMPFAQESLLFLKEKKISCGIVSNAQFYTPLMIEALMEQNLQTLGIDENICVWSFKEQEAKPSSRLFRKALEQLDRHYGIRAPETLYVGNDMLNDIWPAAQLGLKTALFAGDTRSLRLRSKDARINGVKADVVLTDLSQLKEIFS